MKLILILTVFSLLSFAESIQLNVNEEIVVEANESLCPAGYDLNIKVFNQYNDLVRIIPESSVSRKTFKIMRELDTSSKIRLKAVCEPIVCFYGISKSFFGFFRDYAVYRMYNSKKEFHTTDDVTQEEAIKIVNDLKDQGLCAIIKEDYYNPKGPSIKHQD